MHNDVRAAIEAGNVISDPKQVGRGQFVAVPEGYSIEDLERFMDKPLRARRHVFAHDAESFSDYVNAYKAEKVNNPYLSASLPSNRVQCILDYHAETDPAFCDHMIRYEPPHSEEWKRWRANDGAVMSQSDFARFIEENADDIQKPEAAKVIEVSRSLQAKKKVDFVSDTKLSDGSVQFTYNETVEGSASRGNVKVPDEFTLGLPIYFNGVAYKVRARLRFRINAGNLSMWYDLHRREYVEQDAFLEIVKTISGSTGLKAFMGAV